MGRTRKKVSSAQAPIVVAAISVAGRLKAPETFFRARPLDDLAASAVETIASGAAIPALAATASTLPPDVVAGCHGSGEPGEWKGVEGADADNCFPELSGAQLR